MLAPDGKMRLRDAMATKDIFRLIESIPSPKAESKDASDYWTTLKRRMIQK